MKKKFFFLIFLFFSTLTFGQSALDSLRLVLPVENHTSPDFKAVYSPNGQFILSSRYNVVYMWDVKSGKLIHSFFHDGYVNSYSFSYDNNFIVTATGNGLSEGFYDFKAYVWNVSTGEIIKSFEGHNERVLKAELSSDNRYLVSEAEDYSIRIWDFNSGNEVERIDSVDRYFEFSIVKNRLLVKMNNDREARIYNIESGELINTFLNKSDISAMKIHPNGDLLIINSFEYSSIIYEVSTGKELYVFKGHTNKINYISFSFDGIYVSTSSEDGTTCIYNLLNGNLLQRINSQVGFADYCEFSKDNKNILTASRYGLIEIWDFITGNKLMSLNDSFGDLYGAVFSPDGKFFLSTSSKKQIQIRSVQDGSNYKEISRHDECFFTKEISIDGKFILSSNGSEIIVWNSNTGKNVSKLTNFSSRILSARISLDNKKLIVANENSSLSTWDLSTGNLLYEINLREPFDLAFFSNDLSKILTRNNEDYIASVWNCQTGEKLYDLEIFDDHIVSAEFSLNDKFLITGTRDGISNIWVVSSGKKMRRFKKHGNFISYVGFSFDLKYAVTTGIDYYARIWDIKNKNEIVKFHHDGPVNIANISLNNEKLITSSWDHTTRIWDVKSGTELKRINGEFSFVKFLHNGEIIFLSNPLNIILNSLTANPIYERIQLENNNWLVKLPNSPYYMCSKDASKMLHYVTPSLKVIGFEQLDPVYNRPDIVLDSIGKYFGGADQELVANYRQSWEKRIDRLGLDKEKLGKGDIAVPNAEIQGSDDIAYENKEGKLEIKVSANDPKYPLRRFNVFVNEVPLYGSAGISIAHLKKQVWDTTVSVALSVGENKIQVSVMNELGLENFKYQTYLNYTPEKEIVAKTHYIGIGVNAFKDSSHNLNYCVKDVQDLAKAFATENKNIDTLLFTDQQVTRENILAIKEYLKKTSVNDKVIISCSSHGLLDDSLNFYLAMHDVDFDNPKARGLKYEELESLLDGIPARQKLLLLDACNSGENDKTEVLKKELQQKEKNMDSTQVLAARGVIIKLEEENKSNFKKMNELFVNVRNNTGSVIISAAGGQESALEAIKVDGKTIENGAFTYSILECLKQNEGKELKVNALKQYAEKRVEEITNGKQKPTSRQETMEVDWGVR